ncbi:hypothetical protein Dimus_036767, partial [Dionaea muscipula]
VCINTVALSSLPEGFSGLGFRRRVSDRGLAPPDPTRRRGRVSFTEECKFALRAVPTIFGRVGESQRLRARRFGDAVEMTGDDTGEFPDTIHLGTVHEDSASIEEMTLTCEMVLPEDMAAMAVMQPMVVRVGSDDGSVTFEERSSSASPMGATLPPMTSSASVSSSRTEQPPLTADDGAPRAEMVAPSGLRSGEVELGGAEVPESIADAVKDRQGGRGLDPSTTMSADPAASSEAVLVAADAALSSSSPLAFVLVCPAGGSADSLE